MGSLNDYCIPGDAITNAAEGYLPKGCVLVSTSRVTVGGQELFAMDEDNADVFEGFHGWQHESPKPCLPVLTDLENITIQGQSKMVSIGAAASCGHAYDRVLSNRVHEQLLSQIGIH